MSAFAVIASSGGGGSATLPISGGGLTLEGTIAQIDGTGLGAAGNAPLEIAGSTTVDGRIVFLLGNVAGANKSRISVVGQRLDDATMVVVEGTHGTVTNGTGIFQIQDSSGVPFFQVLHSADAKPQAILCAQDLYVSAASNPLRLSGTGPNVDGRSLAGSSPMQIQGSDTVDGRIVLTLGNVAGANKSRVSISGTRLDDATLVIVEGTHGTVTNGTGIFQIQDSGGTPFFQVLHSVDADVKAVVFGGGAYPGVANLDIGKSGSRWRTLYGTTVDLNGLILSATGPQVDGRTLGSNGPLQISASTTTDGRIVLNLGNVAGANKSRISVVSQRLEDAALVIVEGTNGTVTTGTGIFQVQDSSGVAFFQILHTGDSPSKGVVFGGSAVPGVGGLTLGLSANRWSKLWVTDIDYSGTLNPAPSANQDLLVGEATSGLSPLTSSYQDVPGCTVTLTKNGTWLIAGNFGWAAGSADGTNRGQLLVNGVAQSDIASMSNPGGPAFAIQSMQMWSYSSGSANGQVAKLQAKNDSPGGGAQLFGPASSKIVALFCHS